MRRKGPRIFGLDCTERFTEASCKLEARYDLLSQARKQVEKNRRIHSRDAHVKKRHLWALLDNLHDSYAVTEASQSSDRTDPDVMYAGEDTLADQSIGVDPANLSAKALFTLSA